MSEEEKDAGPYGWYVVILCMVAYIFSFVDRQILALLIDPIRADLEISDTQFSLLHGLAFSLFYAVMGIPIARLADTKSRPLIIAVGIFFWSLATAATGFGKTFWHIFVARMGVGVGEAALSPAAYSMITDLFPKRKLGRALAVYSIGSFIGGGLAFLVGGAVISALGDMATISLPLVGEMRPWQVTFLIVGLPGIAVALLFFFTTSDPTRTGKSKPIDEVRFSQTLAFIRKNGRFFFYLYGGFSLAALALFGLMSWLPAFLGRKFGLGPGDIGIILGPILLIANTGGVLASGWLTDYYEKQGKERAAMRSGMVGAMGLVIPAMLFSLIDSQGLTIALIAIALFFASFPLATSAAMMQIVSPPHMRAQVSAIFLFVSNLIGLGIGTTLIALITDYGFGDDASVGYSISMICSLSAIGAALLLALGVKSKGRILEA